MLSFRRVSPFRSLTGTQKGRSFTSSNSTGHQTSESSKEIAWANPNAGPSQDDRAPGAWRWVYPLGVTAILVASVISRYRNSDAPESSDPNLSKIKSDRAVRMHKAMERLDFATKNDDEKVRMAKDYE